MGLLNSGVYAGGDTNTGLSFDYLRRITLGGIDTDAVCRAVEGDAEVESLTQAAKLEKVVAADIISQQCNLFAVDINRGCGFGSILVCPVAGRQLAAHRGIRLSGDEVYGLLIAAECHFKLLAAAAEHLRQIPQLKVVAAVDVIGIESHVSPVRVTFCAEGSAVAVIGAA